MLRSARMLTASVLIAGLGILAHAQASRWAKPDDPTAKMMIDAERKWAESGCDHNGIEKTILADDYYGTAPDGTHYTKQDAVADSDSTKTPERDCKMFEVKVHFYGDNMAILYGSEVATRPAKPDSKEHKVKLTWTDTWLKRDGKWQIVAAEDMPSEVK